MKDKNITLTVKKIKKLNKPHKNKKINTLDSENNKTSEYAIEINNMNKYYVNGSNIFKVLDNINLKIKKGSFTVILGKSGSGKSTLMNIMSGLIRATEGDVIVNNKDLITFKNSELTNFRANNCGFIFQQYGLLSTLTVEENIKVGENLYKKINKKQSINKKQNKDKNYELLSSLTEEENIKVSENLHKKIGEKQNKDNYIYDLMKKINIYELKDKYPSQLSGGQQQRVSIARCLAKKPSILFGDEPTGAVDSSMTYNILKILKEVNEEFKTTIVIITHDERLTNIADHIIKIANGKIIYDEETTPLKDYEKLFV